MTQTTPRTEAPSRPRRGRTAPALAALLGAALLGAAGLRHLLVAAPASSGSGTAAVSIGPGSDLRRIAAALHEAGLVDHPRLFVWAARLRGVERSLRAGEYRLERGQRLPSLIAALLEGRGRTIAVTIPEGWRLEQIADRLASAGVVGREAFLAAARDRALLAELGIPGASAEGFLFPETYPFPAPAEAAEAVRIMHRQFRRVWAGVEAEAATEAGAAPPDLLATVTLASIVERETSAAEERPVVAAVYLNRLRLGMPLQADPTVIYGIEEFDGNLRRRDLAGATPYNTYVNRGLPPGPIASPGSASLRAVLHPAPVDYLFFVSRNDGTHVFSRTLADHNRAVQRFQAPGRGRT